MLAGLARWLRAAGYDTALAVAGQADRSIADLCRIQARVLITRDRHFAAHPGAGLEVHLLTTNGTTAQARQLAQQLPLDWTLAPFTRCLLDNAPLDPAGPAELVRLPRSARALPGPFRHCPCCGRVYWPGSHVRRMLAQLQRWQREQPAGCRTPLNGSHGSSPDGGERHYR